MREPQSIPRLPGSFCSNGLSTGNTTNDGIGCEPRLFYFGICSGKYVGVDLSATWTGHCSSVLLFFFRMPSVVFVYAQLYFSDGAHSYAAKVSTSRQLVVFEWAEFPILLKCYAVIDFMSMVWMQGVINKFWTTHTWAFARILTSFLSRYLFV